MSIPKIIHQIWIGNKPVPLVWIETWKNLNPDFEHILWTDSEIVSRNFIFKNQRKIDLCSEICGKTDIMRLEILYKYGGIFIDADSICIQPINPLFENIITGFATYENENVRKGLIANGNIAIIPNHPLICDMMDWIHSKDSDESIRTLRSWGSVGPALLTRFLNTGKYSDFHVLPSYTFLPIHFMGTEYDGHRKVYAHQLWGSTNKLYDNPILSISLPQPLREPNNYIALGIFLNDSIEISSLKYTMNSLKYQKGHFGIECIFILEETENMIKKMDEIERMNKIFEKTSRFIRFRILSNSEFEELKINYIRIFPKCILYPDSLQKVINGHYTNVPFYEIDENNKCIVQNDVFCLTLS
jgi:hypothetical protein